LPLPSKSSLYRHYLPRIHEQEANLTIIARIPNILTHHTRVSYATIAVDAVSLDNVFLSDWQGAASSDQPGYAFVYECLPLTTEERCFPLHVKPAASGKATGAHQAQAESSAKLFALFPDPVHEVFIATDEDMSWNSVYNRQFNEWYQRLRSHGINSCLDLMASMTPRMSEISSTRRQVLPHGGVSVVAAQHCPNQD
jgi:hypothetical protein